MRFFFYSLLSIFFWNVSQSQTAVLGTNNSTQLKLFEYYNHTSESKWIKLFRIKNFDQGLGFWGKSGVSGTVYYVDYQGEGGAKVDFVFPQALTTNQKPNIIKAGNASNDFSWYILKNNDVSGKEFYDVYIKTSTFHIGFTFLVRGGDYEEYFIEEVPPNQNWAWSSISNPESVISFMGNGNIGFGVNNPINKLDVSGTIHSKEVKVDVTGWPDYVFRKEYDLPTLAEVEKHINEKGYLKNIPSEEEALKNGISLGEMNAKLLQKIEELTLYMIEVNKKVKVLQDDNVKLKEENKVLVGKVESIEKRK
jgi:hypothetical protein